MPYTNKNLNNKKTNITLDYYNKNAKKYSSETFSVEFEKQRGILLKYLKPGSHILDLGCGSGRDSKVFIEKGYKVTAMDGSIELSKIASEYIGQEVICKKFNGLNDKNIYDAVWACASLIHVPLIELPIVFNNIVRSLKTGGYLYASFKHGDFEGEINGRYFTNFTEGKFKRFIKEFEKLKLIETMVSGDARIERRNEMWLNLILEKC